MKLIVGLGNPGKQYDDTRHNIGFDIITLFAQQNNIKIDKEKFNGLYNEIKIKNEKIILLKPQKYMNLSGIVVKKYMDFFKIDKEDILIIHDDLDIKIGNIKIKANGSSAGHNGLKDIEQNIGSKEYKRIKIGISRTDELKAHVLGKFSKEEQTILKEVKETTLNVLNDYFLLSFDNLMNKYNKKN